MCIRDRVEPKQLDQLLHPNFDDVSLRCAHVVATGLAASPGAATGRIYFTCLLYTSISRSARRNKTFEICKTTHVW